MIEVILDILLPFVFSVLVWQFFKKVFFMKYPKFYNKFLKWSDNE